MKFLHFVMLTMLATCLNSFASDRCSGNGEVGYVCGVSGPEDIVAIPGTRWIVTSGLKQGNKPGRLYLIDRLEKTSKVLFPDSFAGGDYDAAAYPGCPGVVDTTSFSAHGINLRVEENGHARLYVMNHGDREAIEIFEVRFNNTDIELTWKGCVILPEGGLGNGVAPLPGNGIAVTLMVVPEYIGQPASTENQHVWVPRLRDGQVSGYVEIWRSGQGWRKMADTVASGPNGIETSADGRWIWVANWGDREVVRVSTATAEKKLVIETSFSPDNLRWGDDGRLWLAGAKATPSDYFDCVRLADCHNDYLIGSINVETLEFTEQPHPDTRPEFSDVTAAVRIDGEVWAGANPSDRVAYFRLDKMTSTESSESR